MTVEISLTWSSASSAQASTANRLAERLKIARMDIFVKMRNVLRRENVMLTVRVKTQMQSVISQTITTVNGVMWMQKSVSQDVKLIRIVPMKLQHALCTTVLVLVTQG